MAGCTQVQLQSLCSDLVQPNYKKLFLVPRLTVGIFRGYLGISGDLKGQFLPLIKSLILIIIQSYADLCVQETEIFLTMYNTYNNNQRHIYVYFNLEVRMFFIFS